MGCILGLAWSKWPRCFPLPPQAVCSLDLCSSIATLQQMNSECIASLKPSSTSDLQNQYDIIWPFTATTSHLPSVNQPWCLYQIKIVLSSLRSVVFQPGRSYLELFSGKSLRLINQQLCSIIYCGIWHEIYADITAQRKLSIDWSLQHGIIPVSIIITHFKFV